MRAGRLRLFVLSFILITIALAAQAQTALQFVPVVPCRVADTRNPEGPFGGPSLGGQSSRDFVIPSSACSIPSTAAAYSLNVTVVPQGPLGYLTVWPKGQERPVLSTLNSLDGRTKANAAVVPAGQGGAISVFATNTTDLVLDIDGYFVPASTSTLAFFPLTPCRVADTRNPQGPLGGPSLEGGQERAFPVLSSACNVPDNAQGYSLNFSAVPKTPLGYLTVWPTGHDRPVVSTLNALTAAVTANAAIVPAGLSGAISVYASNDTDLVIDIDGYLAPPAPGLGGLSLYALAPCRVLDTRPNGTFSGMIPVAVLESSCAVPGAQAYIVNATAVPKNSNPLGYLTLWPDAEGQPLVSTLNALDGMVTSNMAIVPTLNGDVDAFASNPTDLVVDIFSYFAPILPLSITTTALPAGTVGYNYTTTLGATGGITPYAWSTISGSLPPGLNLNSRTGAISGAPTVAGDYNVTIQVADSATPQATISAAFNIVVNAYIASLEITTPSLPTGQQNSSYNAMLAATGGLTPYTWSITSGSLPNGLALSSSTGAITGTPTGAGSWNFVVQVADSNTPQATATKPLSITISPAVPLRISTTSLPAATAGSAYSAAVTAIGGVYPYTWSISSGKFPTGLNLDSNTGAITGTPVVVGTSNFTVEVVDSETPPVQATAQLSIVVNPGGGGGNLGALSGHYVFYLNGFNAGGAWTLAGSFVSDGNGHISSGEVDGNSLASQPFNAAVSGTYSISTAGLNTITLQGQNYGPATFAFVLSASGNGRMIEYDDTTGQGSRGAGELRKADPTAFLLSKLNGNWAFGLTGANANARAVDVGVLTLSNGNMSNGACDLNGDSGFNTCTFTGTVGSIDPQTGRGTVVSHSNFGDTRHEVIYVASAYEGVLEQIDPTPGTEVELFVGLMEQQNGTFSKASLSGSDVSIMQSIHGSDGLDQSIANIVNFDGNGNFSVIAMDEDTAGTITQDPQEQGTYTVQPNGGLSLQCTGGGCPVGFLFGQNKGMLVGTGNSILFGQFGPQSGGPFSNASITGNYVAGSLPPLDYANGRNELLAGPADGVGSWTVAGDSSSSDGLDQYFGTAVSYSIAANGRGTASAEGDPTPAIVYVISPDAFVILMPKADARVDLVQH